MKTCPCCGRACPDGLVWVYPGATKIWVDGVWIPVRATGADILTVLIDAGGRLSKDELLYRVYGPNPCQPSTLGVHIHSLRRQFQKHLGRSVIETDYGFGWHLEGVPFRRPESVQ